MKKQAGKFIWTPSPQEIEEERLWIEKEKVEIGMARLKKLALEARKVRLNAYKSYSGYSVGAAVLTHAGNVYSAANAEVVTYTETDHAERGAISAAINNGEIRKYKFGRKFIRAIAVSHPGESGPCGGCRQRIAEHADNCLILDVNPKGKITRITSLKILFPYAFTPSHLGK